MPTYQYVASDASRERIRGSIAADSPRHARDLLRGRGYRIEDVQPATVRPWFSLFRAGWQRASKTQVSTLTRELATLLSVGITLADSLETLIGQHGGRTARALMAIHQKILAGASFADAIGDCPELFDDVDVSIVRMGEASGDLAAALHEIAEFKEISGQFQDKVATALLYPAIVLTMAIGITLFLMTSVVPTLLDTLAEAGKELPLATRIVKFTSDLLIHYWWAFLLGALFLVVGFMGLWRSSWGRHRLDTILLRFPYLGPLLLKQSVARISFIVATLIRSGVSLIDAIQIASCSIGNSCLKSALLRAKEALTAGKDLKRTLQGEWVMPPMVVQIFAVGQESGRLDEMLMRLAKDYNNQVASASERLTRLLDPVIIIILAFFVGFIAFATIMPIMEMGHVL